MRKRAYIIVILVLAIILSMLTGCAEKEAGPLRILLDVNFSVSEASAKTVFYDIHATLQSAGRLGEVEVECLPAEGPERETAIDRIRTEIMSGKGPDVFIINCIRDNGLDIAATRDLLFPMPEKTMEAGFFLPLDEYMENNTINAEWDKFPQVVLDAGRNEEGQQIIPLMYTLPAAVYRKSNWQHTPSKELIWEDVLADEELYAHTAPIADGRRPFVNSDWAQGLVSAEYLFSDPHIDHVLGDLADFKEEKLLFTEEELLQRVEEIVEMQEYAKESGVYDETDWYEAYLGLWYNTSSGAINGLLPTDPVTLLPIYSDDGGCTATITAYAVVNRNTRRPEEAFAVIDYLLSLSVMQNSSFYMDHLYGNMLTDHSIPMHEDIFREDCQVERALGGYFTDENFETFSAVRDEMTNAQFSDSLSNKLEEMMWLAERCSNAEERAEVVHDYYGVLKQMIGE